jgi:glycosyltransferase involved in cell wall biosynthesis
VPRVDYWFAQGRRNRLKDGVELVPATVRAALRRPDVLYGNRIFSTGWSVPAAAVTRARVVCHLHGHSDFSPERMRYINRRVDRFVAISHFVADQWLASGIDPAKIEVAHNGIDPSAYPIGGLEERSAARRELDLPEHAFVTLYFGRLDREKGIDVLLRAWQRLGLPPGENLLLVVGSPMVDHDGGAYQAELEGLAGPGVRFVPAREDVVTPLHAADVAVVPSIWEEPFGRTVIEGLSTGRPVLASRGGGIPEILDGPMARFLFGRGDPDDLARRIGEVREWRATEPGLAEACARLVRERFSLATMVDRVEAAFQPSD